MERLSTTKGQQDLMKALESGDLQEASNITSIPLNDLKTILKDTNRHGELIIKAIEKEQSQKSQSKTDGKENVGPEVKSAFDSFKDYLEGLGILKNRFARSALGFSIKLAAKKFFGINLPNSTLGIPRSSGSGNGWSKVGAIGGSISTLTAITKFLNTRSKEKEDKDFATKLKKAKTPVERERVYREMNQKNIAPKRRKQIEDLRYT
jgi:hypothetical protein